MSSWIKSSGAAVGIALLCHLAQAAPGYAPVPVKPLLQTRDLVALPSTVTGPSLTGFSPGGCAHPGRYLVVTGHNLGLPQGRTLVMDTGQRLITLTVASWTATQVKTRLPELFNHHGKVEIGIQSAQHRWQGNPLPVPICKSAEASAATSILRYPSAPVVTPLTPPVSGAVPPNPAEEFGTARQPGVAAEDGYDSGQVPAIQSGYSGQIGGGSLIGAALPPVPEALRIPAPDADVQTAAPHELIAVTSSMDDAKRLAQVMMEYQGSVIRRQKLASLGLVLSTFRLPAQTLVSEALKAVHQQYPQLWIDANHYFRPMTARGGQREPLYQAIARHPDRDCGRDVRIGMLDGPVAMTHPALSGQSIVQKVVFAGGHQVAPVRHATAIASLLVGNPAVPGMGGVVPAANLYVGVVMQLAEDDDMRSTTEDLLAGLDWLLNQSVQVINLSLGGPRNALLELALQRVLSVGVGVAAAAGNGGANAPPFYPAAQPGVIAVTSVDSAGQPAGDANQGDYIDLAAPGVNVWVAGDKGDDRYESGTSLAAALVAAALAQLGGQPAQAEHLFQQAHDLGAKGKDAVFGWGLLQFAACMRLTQPEL